jgi:ubiquinone/menaquinone biosynthesis C-methylase UbiE
MEILKRAFYSAHHNKVHVPRVERVARALAGQIDRARSLLDIGCGDGTVARTIAAHVGAERVAGVDVKVRPFVAIEVAHYDGVHLPFPDGEFEAVVISDVLHHAHDPVAVLRDALRVASRVVAIKDHFRFDRLSNAILLAMDQVGNAAPGVLVRGTYFTAGEWTALVRDAGGRFTGLEWPLRIHDLPWRLITQDLLQFAAKIEHAGPTS